MTEDATGSSSRERIPSGRTVPLRKAAADRAAEALRYRLAGHSYERIAKKVGYANKSSAFRAVERAIKQIPRESAIALKTQTLERLDMAIVSMMPLVIAGNMGAIDRLTRIIEQQAKLTGMYENVTDSGVDEFKAVLVQWRRQITNDADLDDDDVAAEDD